MMWRGEKIDEQQRGRKSGKGGEKEWSRQGSEREIVQKKKQEKNKKDVKNAHGEEKLMRLNLLNDFNSNYSACLSW